MLFASQFSMAGPQVAFRDWNLGHPHVSGIQLNSACWGAPGCVAVGNLGEILFSPDGTEWSRATSPLQHVVESQDTVLNKVCYGNGVFVAVGGEYAPNAGRAVVSTDGLNWTSVPSEIPSMITDIAFGGGLFTCVAQSKVFTSTDGTSWLERPDSPVLVRITYGVGKWVAARQDGVFLQTTDFTAWTTGATWPVFPPPGLVIRDLTFANGKFLAVGGWNQGTGTGASVYLWSEDGTNWNGGTQEDGESLFGILQGCAGADGRFVMAGVTTSYGSFFPTFVSEDAALWTRAALPTGLEDRDGTLADVAGAAGRPFIAVATNGRIWNSADGSAWETVSTEPREELVKIVEADGKRVAVGGRSEYGLFSPAALILVSDGGGAWTPTLPDKTDPLRDVAFGGGLWVAVGRKGSIFTSPDALTWTDRSLANSTDYLEILVHGAGRFVAFSRYAERIFHSADGLAWQAVGGLPTSRINAAAFIDGRFIAVGGDGLILTSADGLTWNSLEIGANDDLLSICRGKGKYVAGGLDHTATSEDGVSWTWHPHENAPRRIAYLDGWFLSDDFRKSRDGVHWTAAANDFPRFYRATSVTFTGNSFLACEGREIWSGSLDMDRPDALTVFHPSGVEIKSRHGVQYRLHESRNLRDWEPAGDWQQGDGDYLCWPVDFSQSAGFWDVETR